MASTKSGTRLEIFLGMSSYRGLSRAGECGSRCSTRYIMSQGILIADEYVIERGLTHGQMISEKISIEITAMLGALCCLFIHWSLGGRSIGFGLCSLHDPNIGQRNVDALRDLLYF